MLRGQITWYFSLAGGSGWYAWSGGGCDGIRRAMRRCLHGSGSFSTAPVTAVDPAREGGEMDDRQKILVVDDQQEIRDVTEAVLSQGGYEISTASSGDEALGHLARAPCDLVLLDINMPEMDGWETLRVLRADEQLSDLAVVMLGLVAVGCLLGLVAARWPENRDMPKPVAAWGYLISSNVAGVLAWFKALRGKKNPIWEPTRR